MYQGPREIFEGVSRIRISLLLILLAYKICAEDAEREMETALEGRMCGFAFNPVVPAFFPRLFPSV
jgi:hypothetical protein